MTEAMLVRYCSPTLAGLKTASLFSCPVERREDLHREISRFNLRFRSMGLCLLPLRCSRCRALLYLYRPARLAGDLQVPAARELLSRCGYDAAHPAHCIARLVRTLETCDQVPHEIGLFLGYPPEDVAGFMQTKGTGWKCSGCWKVYGDAEAAKKTFAAYKKCTAACCRRYAGGCSIEGLTNMSAERYF